MILYQTLLVLCILQEVFRSDFRSAGRMSQIVGRACVLHYRDYVKMTAKVHTHTHTLTYTSGVLEHKWRASLKLHYCYMIDFNF